MALLPAVGGADSGPPAWEDDPEPMPEWDLIAQPDPGFEFDQRLSW